MKQSIASKLDTMLARHHPELSYDQIQYTIYFLVLQQGYLYNTIYTSVSSQIINYQTSYNNNSVLKMQ